jgi:putative tricarboxylic transport membrane protein
LFVAVLLSAFASSRTNALAAIILALVLTGFCALIFVGGLGLPLPLIGPWLNF